MSKELQKLFEIVSNDFNQKFFHNNEAKICQLHDLLDQGSENHNCLACNLSSNYLLIQKHLSKSSHFEDIQYAFASTILLYYLLVEKFFAIFSCLEKEGLRPERYKNSHSTMRKIWSWANFLKHPKAFMYVHEPQYFDVSKFSLTKVKPKQTGEDESNVKRKTRHVTELIDDNFIYKFYTGSKKNQELYDRLKNKTEVWVVFPNFLEINKGLKIEIEEFEKLVKENPDVVNHLHKEATIIEFWNEEE